MVTTAVHYAKEDPGSLVESCQRALEWILRSHQSRPIRRCWIDADYTEEEITILEEEVLPAMEAFLKRVSEIERRLEAEAQAAWDPLPL
jgi:hypothetical protein